MAYREGIFKLSACAIAKPWGGGHLEKLVSNTQSNPIGEYVIFSDLAIFPVKISLGSEEVLLADYLAELGLSSDELPFMIKVLSTAEPISLQNHPSDADVLKLGLEGNGKFECWSILDADADSCAFLGLKQDEDRSVLRQLENDNIPMSHFNACHLTRGDVVKLRPGLIHSTQGRMLFYEIQQKSNHTFRLHDFGRGRDLHVEEAISCMRNQTPDIGKFPESFSSTKFSVAYHALGDCKSLVRRGQKYSVFTWFGNPVVLKSAVGEMELNWADSFLLLSTSAFELIPNGNPTERYASLPMIDMLFEAYC